MLYNQLMPESSPKWQKALFKRITRYHLCIIIKYGLKSPAGSVISIYYYLALTIIHTSEEDLPLSFPEFLHYILPLM